ncbi:sulfatase-like hydrolase/transferase, partial [Candidatus Sumerlaeota bacterium]|nr:sulfatase-like hydrolase/transferase [Candidatus Sumerlaeota bacterium]
KDERVGLPLGEITLPDVLKKAGYVTGMVGKWHLGAAPLFHPMKRGFDEFFGFPGGGHDYFKADTQTDTKEYLVPIQRNGKPVAENEYLTDALSREAVGFVRRHREERFFLYLTYNAPHTPQQAPDKYIERFAAIEDQRRRLYAAMLSALDDGVGHLLDTLRDLNLENDTLVFFFSDNGGPVAVNGSSNGPLRGAKGAVYEGGVRVPFAVQWRGRLPEGKTLQHPVICLDIFPTAVPAGGAQLPADRKIDGVNLLPYMTGQTDAPPHERLFWRTGGGDFFAVREGRFKLVKSRDGQPELYDLDADIGETNDLAAKQPDVVKRLLAACEQWNSELAPPLWPNPAPAKRAAAKRKN